MRRLAARACALLLLTLSACASGPARRGPPPLEGLATYYGEHHRGRLTASGERFNPDALTAAHPSLRFGTYVEVQSLRGPQRVVVRINDRGPFGDARRIIDVSLAAARRLGMLRIGLLPVRLRLLP